MGVLEVFGAFAFIRWLLSRGGLQPAPFAVPPMTPGLSPVPKGGTPPVVWPSTPPATLPAFPSGWEYDEPPPPEVVRRATQLLPTLWAQGSGSRRQEMTGGRWITYVAEVVRGGSRGVTAYRVKTAGRAPVATSPAPTVPPVTYAPATAPAAAPAPPGVSPAASRPAPSPAAVPATYTQPAAAAAPVGPPVVSIQDVQSGLNTLGWQPPLTVDGIAGPKTKAAVSAFQRAHPPLAVDGIAGPLTKAAISKALAASSA